jgi:hypothetical protein
VNRDQLRGPTLSAWCLAVHTSDPNSSGWGQYLFYGFLSAAHTIVDPAGELIDVMTVDMQLGFIDTIAKEGLDASQSSVGTQSLILDAVAGTVIGTSLDGFALTESRILPRRKACTCSTRIRLRSSEHYTTSFSCGVVGPRKRRRRRRCITGLTGVLHVGGKKLLLCMRPYEHGVAQNPVNIIHWLFIHVFDRSTIENEIQGSNADVLIAVLYAMRLA